jgi:hypothetical protein
LEAYQCLDANRGHRGRAIQSVTLKNGPAKKGVSPHLHIERVLWRGVPKSEDEADAAMEQARTFLRPLYDFIEARSR